VELATIFYCLRFGTPLFVASYGSQGYGGEIRSRPHTGQQGYDRHSLYSRCTDHVENTLLLLGMLVYSSVAKNWAGVDHIENTSSVVRIVV
jgi:hypothetical protein